VTARKRSAAEELLERIGELEDDLAHLKAHGCTADELEDREELVAQEELLEEPKKK
jgi:hypothetical protein